MSIVWAPSESQHLTLALANRAFVWIKLEEYQKAETDLEWLLSINKYPQDTLHKIYQRLGIVKFKLRKSNESIEALRKSYELLKLSNHSKEQKRSTIEELNSYIRSAKKLTEKPKIENYFELRVENEHPELPGFSEKLSVKYTEEKGRHTVANAVIEPGEVICQTQPVTAIVKFHLTLEYCYNCLLHVPSPIPCENCAGVIFCSLKCRDEAKQRYYY